MEQDMTKIKSPAALGGSNQTSAPSNIDNAIDSIFNEIGKLEKNISILEEKLKPVTSQTVPQRDDANSDSLSGSSPIIETLGSQFQRLQSINTLVYKMTVELEV